jgi:hypothetical protein
VLGGAAPSQPRIVDPEPLLLVTWECARHDCTADESGDEVTGFVRLGIEEHRLTNLLGDHPLETAFRREHQGSGGLRLLSVTFSALW